MQRDYPVTKIIAMSDYSRHETLEEWILGSEIPFLSKPFTPESVTGIVEEMLNGGEA